MDSAMGTLASAPSPNLAYVRYETKGAIAYVTVNRPKVLNALNTPTWTDLRRAFEQVRDDAAIRGAILTGAGEIAECTADNVFFVSRGRVLTPAIAHGGLEGITRGHIHHVDNAFGFADRLPYAAPIAGLYSCSAGCHPAGSVIGAAGHNAAQRVLKDRKS